MKKTNPQLPKLPKVENFPSLHWNSTGKVANQFIMTVDGMRIFQSYKSIIAVIDNSGNTFLDENTWDYSTTTGKYRNKFLGEDRRATEAKIKSGQYKLVNLN